MRPLTHLSPMTVLARRPLSAASWTGLAPHAAAWKGALPLSTVAGVVFEPVPMKAIQISGAPRHRAGSISALGISEPSSKPHPQASINVSASALTAAGLPPARPNR